MSTDKSKAGKDDDGKVIKAEQPEPAEMIDPFLYRYMQRAVNYDRRWVGTMKLGDTVGCWCTTPFNRPNMGEEATELYNKLKADGTITWEEKGFFFTHAMGVKAREHYEKQVLDGKIKANGKSWKNKHAGFTGVTFEELEKKHPELYKKSTTAAYEKKEVKIEKIKAAMVKHNVEAEELLDDDEVQHVIDETGYDKELIIKLIGTKTVEEEPAEEIIEEAEASFDFDQQDPDEEAITAPVEEPVMEESEDDEELPEEVEEVTAEVEPEKESVAAVTTAEPEMQFDFDVAEKDIVEEKEVTKAVTKDEQSKYKTARVFADTKFEKIHTTCEGVTWKGDDGKMHEAYIIDVPGLGERWLEPGKHSLLLTDNTVFHLNVKVGPAGK